MQEYDARVHVPKGKDKEAQELVDKFTTIVKTWRGLLNPPNTFGLTISGCT